MEGLEAYFSRENQKDFLQISPERRRLEMAVIAPDLFDAHYYSIQPDFFKTYWHGGRDSRPF